MKRRNEKERKRKKVEKIGLKSNICYQHFVWRLFFFKLKKNLVFSEIDNLGIFIFILSCEMKGFILFSFVF